MATPAEVQQLLERSADLLRLSRVLTEQLDVFSEILRTALLEHEQRIHELRQSERTQLARYDDLMWGQIGSSAPAAKPARNRRSQCVVSDDP
jgi:hypothetical protein